MEKDNGKGNLIGIITYKDFESNLYFRGTRVCNLGIVALVLTREGYKILDADVTEGNPDEPLLGILSQK